MTLGNCNKVDENTISYTPPQNERAERDMRAIITKKLTSLWGETLQTVAFVLNSGFNNSNNEYDEK